MHIDTWRWAGVPFYIRAGKRLPITATEVFVDLKRPPLAIFDDITAARSHYFRFRLSPEVGISAGTRTKKLGEAMAGERVELIANSRPAARNRRMSDCSATPCVATGHCSPATTASRRPGASSKPAISGAHHDLTTPIAIYEPGTWGPPAANDIVASGQTWHDPQPEASQPC